MCGGPNESKSSPAHGEHAARAPRSNEKGTANQQPTTDAPLRPRACRDPLVIGRPAVVGIWVLFRPRPRSFTQPSVCRTGSWLGTVFSLPLAGVPPDVGGQLVTGKRPTRRFRLRRSHGMFRRLGGGGAHGAVKSEGVVFRVSGRSQQNGTHTSPPLRHRGIAHQRMSAAHGTTKSR